MSAAPHPDPGSPHEDVLVDARCSVLVQQDGAVLLLHRTHSSEYVLPGGRPRSGESLAACARREVAEECGLDVQIGRCRFVLEVADAEHRGIDLVFDAQPLDPRAQVQQRERHLVPAYVPLDELGALTMRPPLAGYIRGLDAHRPGAAYLGNLWRPDRTERSDRKENP